MLTAKDAGLVVTPHSLSCQVSVRLCNVHALRFSYCCDMLLQGTVQPSTIWHKLASSQVFCSVQQVFISPERNP